MAESSDPPKIPKKSFFKKSSWQVEKPTKTESTDPSSFFRKKHFNDIVKEKTQQKHAETEKLKKKRESDTSIVGSGKRRRPAIDEEDEIIEKSSASGRAERLVYSFFMFPNSED
jgi:hypothetical protein